MVDVAALRFMLMAFTGWWSGWPSLRRAIAEFVEHYHHERNHQGLENELIEGRTIRKFS